MTRDPQRMFVLASGEPGLLAAVEPVLRAEGARVEVALTAEAAVKAMLDSAPELALVDARLPGMELGQLLAAVRGDPGRRLPVGVISDTLSEELKDRLEEGVIDDLLAPETAPEWLRMRVRMALRGAGRAAELERLREHAAEDALRDALTGVYNRSALLGMLFRETDRVQRMNTSLCVILFDIDDFRHWNSRLGAAACDALLLRVVERVGSLLRSYDLLGRMGKDEFLAALPCCSTVNGVLLAERIRMEVFAEPFTVAGRAVRLSACFGVTGSRGRSPVVVLREAEEMLRVAKGEGPDTVRSVVERPEVELRE